MATTTTDNRTNEELQQEITRRGDLEFLAESITGESSITMTDATEAIWGTSGRGNPKAVRIIETLGQYGLVTITGNKKRRVSISTKGRDLLAS